MTHDSLTPDEDEHWLRALVHAPPLALEPTSGARVGRYVLIAPLGRGGSGTVWEARDPEGHEVAIKLLRRLAPSAIRRFKLEFRAMSRVDHPGLVRLLELGEEDGRWYLAMEKVPGLAFDDALRAGTSLPHAFSGLAHALIALHALGFVHRDVKPSNVRVRPDGRVVLLDFGLVASVDAATEVAGTPRYMAPEQRRGLEVGPAADGYALGVMLADALPDDAPEPWRRLADRLRSERSDARPGLDAVLAVFGASEETTAPARDEADGMQACVGRDDTLAWLEACREATRKGGAVALVAGATGLGKTALVHAFARRMRASGGVVLAGRCYESETIPHRALDGAIEALGAWLRERPPHERRELLADDAHALAALFPTLAEVAPTGRADRADAVRALRRLFERIARRVPVLVVLDDLHWGDADSAEVLAEVLARPAPPVLVLGTHRDEDGSGPFVERLERAARDPLRAIAVHRTTLAPLTPDHAGALARALGAAPERIEEIVARAEGVPWLIGELALRSSLEERVDRLSPSARALLHVVAVAERGLPLAVAVEASLHPAGMLDAHALRAARLVRLRPDPIEPSSQWVEPYHDLGRQAVRAAMAPADALHLHTRLAARFARHPRLAEHAVPHLVACGDLHGAERALSNAIQRARERFAFAHGAELATRWVAMLRSAGAGRDAIARALVAVAELREAAQQSGPAAAAWEEAALALPDAEAYEARARATGALLLSGETERGLAILRTTDRTSWRAFHRNLVLTMIVRAVQAWRALRWAESPPGSDAPTPSLVLAGQATMALSVTDARRANGASVAFVARALAQRDPDWIALGLMACANHDVTIFGRETRLARGVAGWLERRRDALSPRVHAYASGLLALHPQQLGQAHACFQRALAAPPVSPAVEGMVGPLIAWLAPLVALLHGRVGSVRDAVPDLLARHRGSNTVVWLMVRLVAALAEGLLGLGGVALAREALDDAERAWGRETESVPGAQLAVGRVYAALAANDPDDAEAQLERALRRSRYHRLGRLAGSEYRALQARVRLLRALHVAGRPRERLLARCETDTRALAREPLFAAQGALVAAGVAMLRGAREDRVAAALVRARELCTAQGLGLGAMATHLALTRASGPPAEEARTALATWCRAERIGDDVDLAAALAFFLPTLHARV
jgi:serine/threonine protein kinase/tetratricopeptide (TPR) repeat protein